MSRIQFTYFCCNSVNFFFGSANAGLLRVFLPDHFLSVLASQHQLSFQLAAYRTLLNHRINRSLHNTRKQKEVAQAAGITDVTLRNRFKGLKDKLS
jgi:transcription initiation factor TFIIIB Brf1 subunit/transcription initiation factor TFIIB